MREMHPAVLVLMLALVVVTLLLLARVGELSDEVGRQRTWLGTIGNEAAAASDSLAARVGRLEARTEGGDE